MDSRINDHWLKTVEAVVLLLGHAIVVFTILALARLSEFFVTLLWAEHPPLIGGMQLKEIVFSFEMLVLFVFLIIGSIKAALVFWR